jgi:hypothetical protein
MPAFVAPTLDKSQSGFVLRIERFEGPARGLPQSTCTCRLRSECEGSCGALLRSRMKSEEGWA